MRRPRARGLRRLRGLWLNARPVNNEMTKRLAWSGLLAAVGALTSIVANRIAVAIWMRVTGEDPPE